MIIRDGMSLRLLDGGANGVLAAITSCCMASGSDVYFQAHISTSWLIRLERSRFR